MLLSWEGVDGRSLRPPANFGPSLYESLKKNGKAEV